MKDWNEQTAEKELKLAGGKDLNKLVNNAGLKKKYTGNNYYQRMLMRLNGYERGMRIGNKV